MFAWTANFILAIGEQMDLLHFSAFFPTHLKITQHIRAYEVKSPSRLLVLISLQIDQLFLETIEKFNSNNKIPSFQIN
jgi:hypothetical protein